MKAVSVLCFGLCLSALESAAATVFVRGASVGQGFTRSRGRECFVITAKHVVEERRGASVDVSPTIEIVAPPNFHSSADIEYGLPGDVVIYRVKTDAAQQFCPADQDWLSALGSDIRRDAVKRWQLELVEDSGTLRPLDVMIVGEEKDILYYIKAADGIRQTMSGSPLRADGHLAGILLTTSNGIGSVFRLPYVDSIVDRIFRPRTGTATELTLAELQRIDAQVAIARVALDRGDCRVAVGALGEVPIQRRAAIWTLYQARSLECESRSDQAEPEGALKYYSEYNTMVPGQQTILEKIARLGYATRKRAEAANLRRDLTGRWRYDSNVLSIQQSGNKVTALFQDVSRSFSESGYRPGDVYFDGTYSGGVVTGFGRQRDVPSDDIDCKHTDVVLRGTEEIELPKGLPLKPSIKLMIDGEGNALSGTRETFVAIEQDRKQIFLTTLISYKCVLAAGPSLEVKLERER